VRDRVTEDERKGGSGMGNGPSAREASSLIFVQGLDPESLVTPLAEAFCILMKQKMTRWQWYQLDLMQIICTLLQTIMPALHHIIFLQTGCSSWCQTNSVKALMAQPVLYSREQNSSQYPSSHSNLVHNTAATEYSNGNERSINSNSSKFFVGETEYYVLEFRPWKILGLSWLYCKHIHLITRITREYCISSNTNNCSGCTDPERRWAGRRVFFLRAKLPF